MKFIEILETCLMNEGIIKDTGEKKELLSMRSGDVYQTYADISDLKKILDSSFQLIITKQKVNQ